MRHRLWPQPDTDGGISPALWEYMSRCEVAASYDSYFRGMGLFGFDVEVLDVLFDEPGRLLDLGCGTGRHVVHFARRGFDVTGVDLSEHMISLAREKLAAADLSARFVRANFCDLNMLDARSFDYVICMFSTLGMIKGRSNRAAALREAFRVLVPGGMFVMHAHNRLHNVWSRDGLGRLLKSYLGAALGRCEAGDVIIDNYRGIARMYLHSYTDRELRAAISAAGLRVCKLLYLNESRRGVLKESLPASILANGFIAVARKPFNPA